eukprot:1157976-Pelagomonas_calceolata.AAC.9
MAALQAELEAARAEVQRLSQRGLKACLRAMDKVICIFEQSNTREACLQEKQVMYECTQSMEAGLLEGVLFWPCAPFQQLVALLPPAQH